MEFEDQYFVHLSDTHIHSLAHERLHGQDTQASFRAVIDYIALQQINPSFVLITGDLSDYGEWPSYRRLRNLVAEAESRLSAPVLLAIGNHDYRAAFRQVMLDEPEATDHDKYYYSKTIRGLRVIVLDSAISGKEYGEIGSNQLTWLEHELASGPQAQPTVLAFHHPPHLTGNSSFDNYSLGDRAELERVISGHNVLGIFSGHVHFSSQAQVGDAVSLSAPSTAYLADPARLRGIHETEGIGFSLVSVRSGKVTSQPIILPGRHQAINSWSIDLPQRVAVLN